MGRWPPCICVHWKTLYCKRELETCLPFPFHFPFPRLNTVAFMSKTLHAGSLLINYWIFMEQVKEKKPSLVWTHFYIIPFIHISHGRASAVMDKMNGCDRHFPFSLLFIGRSELKVRAFFLCGPKAEKQEGAGWGEWARGSWTYFGNKFTLRVKSHYKGDSSFKPSVGKGATSKLCCVEVEFSMHVVRGELTGTGPAQ